MVFWHVLVYKTWNSMLETCARSHITLSAHVVQMVAVSFKSRRASRPELENKCVQSKWIKDQERK